MKLKRTEFGVAVSLPDGSELALCHIIGIGRNYAEHAHETGSEVPDRPMYFTKNPASAVLHGDDIVIPPACQDPETGGEQVDFEAELAVIIGRRACDVPHASALDVVLGYCCANDVSARWWQKKGAGGQFCRGKSFDTFCPLGPEVIARDDVGDPSDLSVTCRVSGETMQDARTSLMLFDIPTLISELSRSTTLLPGTVILTGTPSGVGMARTPPRFLHAGDVVEVEIERVGLLRNPVVAG